MARTAYDLRENLDGSWSVYETDAGRPAIVNGLPQVALRLRVAEKVADRLIMRGFAAAARVAAQKAPVENASLA